MKKLFGVLLMTAMMVMTDAQIVVPQASVASEQKTTVGTTDITINYSRPSMRGRTIFGNVVPYGQMWRTGANANTTIEFTDDVVIDGQTLPAGKYAIFTKPEEKGWEIFFYKENDNWGNQVKWDEGKVVAQTKAEVKKIPNDMTMQSFLITIGDITNEAANLNFMWENTWVSTEIQVPTDKKAMASIEKTMKGNAKANEYIGAANYYYNNGKDIKQAKIWMDEGMKMMDNKPYYLLHQQALIYEKAGDKKGAIKLAQESLEAAKKAGDGAYIRMNNQSLAEWMK